MYFAILDANKYKVLEQTFRGTKFHDGYSILLPFPYFLNDPREQQSLINFSKQQEVAYFSQRLVFTIIIKPRAILSFDLSHPLVREAARKFGFYDGHDLNPLSSDRDIFRRDMEITDFFDSADYTRKTVEACIGIPKNLEAPTQKKAVVTDEKLKESLFKVETIKLNQNE